MIKDSDQLIELVESKIKELPEDHKKKLEQVLWELDLKDNSIQLFDHRTLNIVENLECYQADLMRPFNDNPPKIWKDAVIVYNRMKPRLF